MGEFKPTLEQKRAIEVNGSNVLVSAGAGSGKTRVLTERILSYVKNGIDINRLLVLTFTKNAAAEMKSRIRDGLIHDPSLKDQLLKVETSPITNFDSFSLSFVKKYYYVLNIEKDLNIGDTSFFLKKTRDFLREIFEDYYLNNDQEFYDIIRSNGEKDDRDIFNAIVAMYQKLCLKPNFNEYLTNFKRNNFKIKDDEELYNDFMQSLLINVHKIRDIYYSLGEYNEYLNKNKFSEFVELNDYDEIKAYCDKYPKFVTQPRKFMYADLHKTMKDLYNEVRDSLIYQNKEDLMFNLTYSSTKGNFFYKTLIKLNKMVMDYKYKINTYEFIDIAKMAIKVLKENPIIREENKNKYYEILIDEYQDTSDIQEEFINLLSNNNVYMVGDIKQSIYRFRNANCDIFKEKYLNYGNNNGGVKVDMTNNFRSRSGVISTINDMFDNLMDLDFGGADYVSSHHMKAANTEYELNGKKEKDYSLVILKYDKNDRSKKYPIMSHEALIIGNDIQEKINSGYKVYDDKLHSLRPCTYNDFALITSTNSHFKVFKKVFDYLQIPLQVYQNESITESKFILVLHNLLLLYKHIYLKDYKDVTFKHAFMSVGRSLLFDYSDQELFDIMKSYKYYDTEIFKLMSNIIHQHKYDSNINIFNAIINDFDVYNKLVRDDGVKEASTIIEFIIDKIISLESAHIDFIEFVDYISCLIEEEYKLEYQGVLEDSNSVVAMNIHKSKGLEYKIIYFFDNGHGFNMDDLKLHYNFDDNYGFMINRNGFSPLRNIANYFARKEEISEKIRLFYVALTRAKESMIFVTKANLEDGNEVAFEDKINFSCFDDLLMRLKPYLINRNCIRNVEINYPFNFLNENKKDEDLNEFKLEKREVKIESNNIEKGHASNIIKEVISKETYKMLHEGTKFHEILESLDLKNPDFTGIDEFYVTKIKAFLSKVDVTDATIYQEHEFYVNIDNHEINGIIDLLLEYDDRMVVIDYKLSNASVEKYQSQLDIYRKYVNSVSNKPCSTYLYSLLKEELVEVK